MKSILFIAPIVALLFTGCAANDALKKDIQDLKSEVAALRAEIKELKKVIKIE